MGSIRACISSFEPNTNTTSESASLSPAFPTTLSEINARTRLVGLACPACANVSWLARCCDQPQQLRNTPPNRRMRGGRLCCPVHSNAWRLHKNEGKKYLRSHTGVENLDRRHQSGGVMLDEPLRSGAEKYKKKKKYMGPTSQYPHIPID